MEVVVPEVVLVVDVVLVVEVVLVVDVLLVLEVELVLDVELVLEVELVVDVDGCVLSSFLLQDMLMHVTKPANRIRERSFFMVFYVYCG